MLNARCAKERFCFSPSGMRCPCVGGGAGRRWCESLRRVSAAPKADCRLTGGSGMASA